MTRSALDRVATMPRLREAWSGLWRVGRKQLSTGVDGVTVKQFAGALESNLSSTLHMIRSGYEFSALRGIPLPKPNSSKKRIISVPTVRDRLVQRLLSEYLWEKADDLGIRNEVSFGFVRNRGVEPARDAAIAYRNKHPWAYKSDIVAFFDKIDREALITDSARCLKQRSLTPVLTAAAGCEIDLADPAVARVVRENGISTGLGVRQGMPLSPLFANIALRKFDAEMKRHEYRMVRYADDFIVLCDSRKECEKVDSVVTSTLSTLGHTIPALDLGGKTRIAAPHESVEFLGLALTPFDETFKLIITDDQIDNLKRELYLLKSLDYLRSRSINIGSLSARVDARVGGLRSAYKVANNFSKLERILVSARSEIMRKVFTEAFGEKAVKELAERYWLVFGLD